MAFGGLERSVAQNASSVNSSPKRQRVGGERLRFGLQGPDEGFDRSNKRNHPPGKPGAFADASSSRSRKTSG